MHHQQEARRVLDLVLAKLADAGKVERPPSMDGCKMTVLLVPGKAPATCRSQPGIQTQTKEASS
jgi:translation initiation factor IF-3